MALTQSQIQSLLNDARAAGLDADELAALEWVLLDRAADLDGATRLDLALLLAEEAERRAAEQFLQDSARLRREAMQRGIQELNAIMQDEWERLTNGD